MGTVKKDTFEIVTAYQENITSALKKIRSLKNISRSDWKILEEVIEDITTASRMVQKLDNYILKVTDTT